jgi:hypothetical protein
VQSEFGSISEPLPRLHEIKGAPVDIAWNTEERWQTKSAWDLRFRLRPPMLYLMYLVWSLLSYSKTQRNVMNREG